MKRKKIKIKIHKYFIHVSMFFILTTIFLCINSSSSMQINQSIIANTKISNTTFSYRMNDSLIINDLNANRIVYDNMTIIELTNKLNRVLKGKLANYGYVYASKSLEYGVDPYVAVSISLLETGCNNGSCSSLVNNCNNVGGMKGSPGCGGGSFKRFSNLDEGINQFLKNLGENYYAVGLDTPEKMNPKYAESTEWARKVNNYINYIRKI